MFNGTDADGKMSPFGEEGMSYTQARGLGSWIYKTSEKMKYLSEGQLIAKSITSTQSLLLKVFPAEFSTRNLGHKINIPGSIISCENFMNKASTNLETINNTCQKFNFGQLEDLRFFVNGTWFGQNATVMAETGMNMTEMNNFYNASIVGSFGAEIATVLSDTANMYNCTSQSKA